MQDEGIDGELDCRRIVRNGYYHLDASDVEFDVGGGFGSPGR